MTCMRKAVSAFTSLVLAFSLFGVPSVALAEDVQEEAWDSAATESTSSLLSEGDADVDSGNLGGASSADNESGVPCEGERGLDDSSKLDPHAGEFFSDSVYLEADTALSYVYLAFRELSLDTDQEIVFELADGSLLVNEARLTYQEISNGALISVSAEAVSENAAAFVFGSDTFEVGEYRLVAVEYTLADSAGEWHRVDLSDNGWSFTVTEQVVVEEVVTAYYEDDSGEMVETGDLDAALDDVVVQGGSAASVYSLSRAAVGNSVASPVIALDPGHGGVDPGACANGLEEADLTWKIAVACKERLESYGFIVVLTRGENDELGSDDYKYRVARSLEAGAAVYVSLHINSYDSSAAHGVEVLVPENTGSGHTQVSADLANRVLEKLTALGLYDRGLKTRMDLAVINASNNAGIPGILIEHGFITNTNDVANYLTDEGCARMGQADAEAIAAQFPQSTWIDYSAVYDYDYYMEHNPDVVNAYGVGNPAGVLSHFVIYGMKEGRQASSRFNVSYYKQNYEDLRNAFGDDTRAYYTHYMSYGLSEGRVADRLLEDQEDVPLSLSAEVSADQRAVELRASGGVLSSASSVSFPVWSEAGGQDDLVWYAAEFSGGAWTATVPVSAHAAAGAYSAHAYATTGGSMVFAGTTSFSIDAPSASVSVAEDADAGAFEVTVSGVSSPSGVSRVDVPVWSEAGGQDDIVWYRAVPQADGTYRVRVSMAGHGWSTGAYNAHVYVMAGNGVYSCVGCANTGEMKIPGASLWSDVSSDQRAVELRASGGVLSSASSVSFPVWSEAGGQDDLVWYAAEFSGGAWTATVPVSAHAAAGAYSAHAYATTGGSMVFAGAASFSIDAPSASVSVAEDADAGAFEVTVSGVSSPSGVSRVDVPVWSEAGGQDDIVWYRAVPQADGTYRVRVSMAGHGWSTGAYNAHVYVMAGNGVYSCVGCANTGEMKIPGASLWSDVSSDQRAVELRASGGVLSSASSVSFPVWSEAGGQDDLVWYAAEFSGGAWTATVPVSAHAAAGAYSAHAYATTGGSMVFAGAASFSIDAPSASVSVAEDADAGAFEVTVSGVSSPSGVSRVDVPVWSEAGGQDDIVWYRAVPQADGTYRVRVSMAGHGWSTGAYNAHVYVMAGNGVYSCVGCARTGEMVFVEAAYPIMGNSNGTVSQMVALWNSTGKNYPSIYANFGAPTVNDFCQIVYDEALKEGVRAEVVFAQAMLETGWLQFGGDVKAEQCNFCGLGATGNGNPGHSFDSVRIGICAQVQHLKAYASTEPLNNACVDPRFDLVRGLYGGQATTLGSLSQKWASGETYGNNIAAIVKRLLVLS